MVMQNRPEEKSFGRFCGLRQSWRLTINALECGRWRMEVWREGSIAPHVGRKCIKKEKQKNQQNSS